MLVIVGKKSLVINNIEKLFDHKVYIKHFV